MAAANSSAASWQDDRRAIHRGGLHRDRWSGHEGSILRFVFSIRSCWPCWSGLLVTLQA